MVYKPMKQKYCYKGSRLYITLIIEQLSLECFTRDKLRLNEAAPIAALHVHNSPPPRPYKDHTKPQLKLAQSHETHKNTKLVLTGRYSKTTGIINMHVSIWALPIHFAEYNNCLN